MGIYAELRSDLGRPDSHMNGLVHIRDQHKLLSMHI